MLRLSYVLIVLVIATGAFAWTHGVGGGSSPSNRITQDSNQRITEDGNNRITQ